MTGDATVPLPEDAAGFVAHIEAVHERTLTAGGPSGLSTLRLLHHLLHDSRGWEHDHPSPPAAGRLSAESFREVRAEMGRYLDDPERP